MLNVWIARKPPGFGFVLMGSRRAAEDSIGGLNGERIGGYRLVFPLYMVSNNLVLVQGDGGVVQQEGG